MHRCKLGWVNMVKEKQQVSLRTTKPKQTCLPDELLYKSNVNNITKEMQPEKSGINVFIGIKKNPVIISTKTIWFS